MPFLYPRLWRSLIARVAMSPDNQLRLVGLASMIVGVACLYLLNQG